MNEDRLRQPITPHRKRSSQRLRHRWKWADFSSFKGHRKIKQRKDSDNSIRRRRGLVAAALALYYSFFNSRTVYFQHCSQIDLHLQLVTW